MFSFLMAILSSSLVSISMRASEKHARNNLSMLACNYLMCSVLALLFAPTASLFPAAEGIGRTLFMGVFNGILYLASFVIFNRSIRRNGVVLSTTFMKLGVIVPILQAVFLFGEAPTLLQLIGIAAAITAIVLIRSEKGGQGVKGSMLALLFLCICNGMASGMSKVYEVYGNPALSDQFLQYTFIVALLLCTVLALANRQSIAWVDFFFGLLIGIPNYFSARFMLHALNTIPAVVAYPVYSVATIVVVTLTGVLFFKEKLSRRQVIALAVIMAALVLLNL